MTTLVIGATGNIGRAVFLELLERGLEVRASSRNPAAAGLPAEAEVFAVDLNQPESLPAALKGVDRVFLYAATRHPTALAGALAEAGAPHVVLVSSASVLAPDAATDPIGARHLFVEQAIIEAGLPYTFLRPGAFASNAIGWARPIRATSTVRLPYPNAELTPIHELDLRDVAVAALTGDDLIGATPWLTGPESLTQRVQVQAIAAALGRPIEFVELTPEQGRAQLSQFMPEQYVNSLLRYWAAGVGVSSPVSPQGPAITGHPGRTFAQWAQDHVPDFS